MDKIKSISEAFSMQPATYRVGSKYGPVEIRAESVCVGREYGNPIEQAHYVGYDENGQKLFSVIAIAHNVQYEPTQTALEGSVSR